jgi:hypothetical protein
LAPPPSQQLQDNQKIKFEELLSAFCEPTALLFSPIGFDRTELRPEICSKTMVVIQVFGGWSRVNRCDNEMCDDDDAGW